MSWVVKHARTIKRSCWIVVVLLSMLSVIGTVDRYQRQRVMLLESQQALLSQRSAWGYSSLLSQLQIHKLQQSLLRANPPPKGCLSDEFIARQHRSTTTQTADGDGLSLYTLQVPIHQLAPMPKPQTPGMRLSEGSIRMTSRQLLGYTCDGRYAVIQEAQTRLEPQPLLLPQAMGSVVSEGIIVHVALTQGQGPTLYFDIRFTSGKAEYLPSSAAAWSTSKPDQMQGEARFIRQYANLHQGLQMHIYSELLTPNFLQLFFSVNGLGLVLAVGILACLLLINWLVSHLIDASVVAHRAATRDFLTGLHNRRAVMALTEAELARAAHKPGSLCLLMLDIDHFKQVNDTYGHDGGDQVLKFFALLLTRKIRQRDLLARVGGEEFLIVLPDTDLNGAQKMATRLLQALRHSTVEYAGNQFGITCSMGVTAWRGPDDSFQDMLIRADMLLYQGKQQGRDRFVSDPLQAPALTEQV